LGNYFDPKEAVGPPIPLQPLIDEQENENEHYCCGSRIFSSPDEDDPYSDEPQDKHSWKKRENSCFHCCYYCLEGKKCIPVISSRKVFPEK
jgi:hypothetical protein